MPALPTARKNYHVHALLAVVWIGIGSARIVSTYTVFSHTIDEPTHLAAGMEYLSVGKYWYEDQHPPLARLFGAIGPFLAGERFRQGPNSTFEGYRILGHDAHYERTLALGRLGILPFFWIGSWVVFLWAYRAGGPLAANIATLLFTTLPPILAHAGLITTDMAAAAFTGAAAYAGLLWIEAPTRTRSMAFGAVLGLAAVSKFSSLAFLPAAWLLMYGWYLLQNRPGLRSAAAEIVKRRRPLAVVLGVAFLVIWATYRFGFARVEFLRLRLPAPRFFSGIASVWNHNQAGGPSYLLGHRSSRGTWYYFPVVLAVKTPLAMLLSIAMASVTLRRMRITGSVAMPLAFSIAILMVGMASRINLGVRHILPIYIGLSVVCGAAAARFMQDRELRGPQRAIACATMLALLVWHIASGAWQAPDYLAYTNEIAADHPEKFVADSDLDWGQDMKRLGHYCRQKGISEIAFKPFDSSYVSVNGPLAGPPLPRILPTAHDHPSAGWNAVSLTLWKVFGDPAWVDGAPPPTRIGRSIWLWYFPPAWVTGE